MLRGLIVSVLVLGGIVPHRAIAAEGVSKRPNVIFILADDLGWGELGCYGQQKIPTPNLDALAARGMRFTQHYSGAPVCAPSRCVLMTGKHLGHAEIRGNQQARKAFPEFDEGQYPISASVLTLAQLFRDQGYATGAMGKWGLGPVGSTGDPNRKGFDLFFGYNCQAVAHSYYPSHLWRNADRIEINQRPIPGHRKQPEGDVAMGTYLGETYAPDLMIREAEAFLDRHHEGPFFLYLPFIEPHVAMHPPRDRVERFPKEWDAKSYRGGNGYLPHPRPRAAYAAMIAELDGYVGRVMEKLKGYGIEEETLVIFSSDNGATHPGNGEPDFHIGGADPVFFNSTAGLRGYKGSVYEGGIRVPTIARLPGVIPAGVTGDYPSYFADWFPTLCDAIGAKRPGGLDGVSLWNVLSKRGPAPKGSVTQGSVLGRNAMVWVFPEYGGQVAVRIGNLKGVRQGLKTGRPGGWEVYDLAADPGESQDLAATSEAFLKDVEAVLDREVDENEVFPLAVDAPVTSAR
jgi:arylsulfatase A-like enzyme